MNSLTKVLLEDLVEAENKKVTAIYGGGFKPPTKGHFAVVQKAAEQNPEIDEFIIYVGSGNRDGIGQAESIMIWELYKKHLPLKVRVEPVKAPIGDILRYAKEHPEEEVLWVIGARENNPEDFMDIASRTRTLDKYPNLELRVIQTSGGVSGTAARKAIKDNNKEQFYHLIPDIEEKEQVWDIVSPLVKEGRKKKPDPKKGTGKKPEGSGRRLYTDEDPKDTVRIKFKTKEDIVDTLNKKQFKAKSHARQSQVINLIHQRVRAAYGKAKDSEVKARLKRALDYIEGRKEASKKKTERLRKMKEASDPQAGTALPYGSGFAPVKEIITATDIICDNCGWEWAIKDGGDDLYICHKCGHDNTPKQLNENSIPSIDIKEKLNQINQYMISKGYNIEPLPSVEIIDNDKENAEDYLGKTAYYNPNEKKIVLYTYGRHPKDISRSYTHEMIHHIQNLENRLGNITTTNTLEDDHLDKIEQEANLKGTMTFRNFTDDLQKKKDPFGLLKDLINEGRYDNISRQLANYTIKGWKDDQEHGEPSSRLEFEVGPNKDLEYGDLEFLYNAVAVFAGSENYSHNGYAKPVSSEVGIQFSIPSDMLPQSWERIYMDLISTIRHEIEHLTQSGKNVKPGKEMASDAEIRNKLKQSIERGTDYFKLDKEVDANLHGLYLKAKKIRKPFEDVVNNYLKFDLNLSLDQIEDVKNAWRPRLKALSLPKI